jgi:hypothetical protein
MTLTLWSRLLRRNGERNSSIDADGIMRRRLIFGTVAAMAFPASSESMAATDGRTQMHIDRFDHVVLGIRH